MEEGRVYGYARVSSKEQHEDRQISALLECGVALENIFMEKQSGKDFNRPEYLRLIAILKPGDTLFIKSVDRLGRNYQEIQDQWRGITKDLKVYIVILDMPLLDTRPSDRDLTGVFIADLVLQILSYVAQTEREFNRQRQTEGIVAAKARGVHLGRPAKAVPDAFEKLVCEWEHGMLPLPDLLAQAGMKEASFYRHLRKMRLTRNMDSLYAQG